MATRKRGSFESNTAKFSQSRHGSFEWNIFLRYLSKLSDIWHFTICKIRRENCRDMLPIRSEIFLRRNVNNSWICMRYAQIYAQCKIFSHWASYLKMAAVGLGIYIFRSMVVPEKMRKFSSSLVVPSTSNISKCEHNWIGMHGLSTKVWCTSKEMTLHVMAIFEFNILLERVLNFMRCLHALLSVQYV